MRDDILDNLHRELSATKRMMRQLREEERDLQEETTTTTRTSNSQREREGPMYDSEQESIHHDENLRGSRRRLATTKDNGPGDHFSVVMDVSDTMDQTFPRRRLGSAADSYDFLLDETMDQALPKLENSTSTRNITAAIDSGSIVDNTMISQLDIGAWLLMVLVVGFAVLGVVTYRSAPRRKGRRPSYQYRSVLPTLNEDDWGAE